MTDALERAASALDEPVDGLVVCTPSFRPDLERFLELHETVLRHTPEGTQHVVVVPDKDVKPFQDSVDKRCQIFPESAVLPPSIRRLPRVNLSVNVRRPLPPLRGWILQQVIKLALADHVHADVMVMVDSDVIFIRDVSIDDFTQEGQAVLYKLPDAVTPANLPRHAAWVQRATQMLGLDLGPPPYPDYVSSLNVWDRRLLIELRRRLEEVGRGPWYAQVGRQVHFSEWMLYGIFADHVAAGEHPAEVDTMRCHTYWRETPMSRAQVVDYFSNADPSDLAVMLSAKSGTPDRVRSAAFRELGYLEPR